MGKIDMSNFGSQKGMVPVAPHLLKPFEFGAKNDSEKFLFLNRKKIRSTSGDILFQTFPYFSQKSIMICKLPCCLSPVKPAKKAIIQAKKKRQSKYELPHTSIGERQAMSLLTNIGKTRNEVAQILNCSKRTVQRQLKRFKETGCFNDKTRSGRNKKLTPEIEEQIVAWIEEDRRNSAPKLKALVLDKFNVDVNERSIGLLLKKLGYFGGVCARKPLFREINKAKRLAFALEHVDKPLEFWKSVLYTDEKKFELVNSKRRIYCWKKKGEELRHDTIQPTVKHGGGSIMMWGCFLGERVGDLHRVQGIMKKEDYHSILQHHAIPSGIRLHGRGFVLQQDNDPKHTSNLCKNYLKSKVDNGTLKLLDWPSQSPDLNPIELLWEEMDRRIKKKRPTSLNDLEAIAREVWREITPDVLLRLIERLPFLCQAVIQAEGGYFDEKYAPRKCKNQKVYKN
jgi:transposase